MWNRDSELHWRLVIVKECVNSPNSKPQHSNSFTQRCTVLVALIVIVLCPKNCSVVHIWESAVNIDMKRLKAQVQRVLAQ